MIALISTLSRADSSGLKPTPSSMNGDSRPFTLIVAGVDRVDAGEALEQRALAAAVAPDDAEELAALDLEAHVLEGRELVGGARREGVQHALLQRRVALRAGAEGLADPLGGDCRWRFREQARPPIRADGRRSCSRADGR